jgi:hypothetical protein
MFRFGVCRPEQYPAGGRFHPFSLRRNRISYQLLRAPVTPSPHDIALFEHIMKELLLSSGVYRMTSPGRFRDLDAYLMPLLERRFSPEKPLRVQDWAVSDASTSVVWFGRLRQIYPLVHLAASDLNLYLVEARLNSGEAFILEPGGALLQYVKPPFVIPLNHPESIFFPVNRWLAERARARFARLSTEAGLSPSALEGVRDETRRAGPFRLSRLSLIHPTAESLRRFSAAFTIVRQSVFEPAKECADVVRTMNIFNRGYFGPDQLAQGIASVWKSLFPDGIWIVGRTIQEEPVVHHVSIFQKTETGFDRIAVFNHPSEVEDLALALRMEPSACR